MPTKTIFRVIHVSGQDDNYKAIELNSHTPTTKGWQSSKFCLFPQDIVIQLEKRSRLRKIQILSHQFLIATKVEFYVGDVPDSTSPNLQNARYTRLGYVALSDNEKTSFKARELKSVHVDAIGCFVKFVIHKNHINKHNLYNQVGIVAINIIGDDISKTKTIDDMGRRAQEADPGLAGIYSRPDYISPLDDLAFDMYQDPEVAGIIRKLELKKQEAVLQERYDYAKKLKDAIASFQKVGEKLGKYEVEKRQAVETEDYEKAKLKKAQMDEYRIQMYKQLELKDLLEVAGARHPQPVDLEPVRQPTPPRLTELPRPPLPPTPCEEPAQITPYDERPLPAIQKQVPLLDEPESEDTPGIKQKEEASGDPAITITPYDERPLPAQKGRPALEPEPEPIKEEPSVNTESETEAQAEVELELLKPKRVKVKKSKTDVAGDVNIASDPGGPEKMSGQDQREAGQAIDVFELPLVTKAYSKTWSFREEALSEMMQRMQELDSAAKDESKIMMRAAIFLINRALKDKVYAVFTTGVTALRMILTEYVPKHRIPKSDTAYSVEKTLQALIQKSGETAARSREAAKQFIVEMSKLPEVKPLHVVTTECVKPFKLTIAPRLGLSRTELLETLYVEHKLQNSGLSIDNMMKFCLQGLQHTSGEIREQTEKLIITLYKESGISVKTYLPPDNDKTRKNVLYKQLFEAFDRIDGKPSKEELKKQRQETEQAKQKEIEALQQQLQSLKDMAAGKAGATAAAKPVDQSVLAEDPAQVKPNKAKTKKNQKNTREKAAPPPQEEDTVTLFQMEKSPLEERLQEPGTCIFCGEKDEKFSEDGMDIHYWKSCPMLKRCTFCKQVVEIAGLSEHLLTECEAKNTFDKCPQCTEAVNKAEYDQHVTEKACPPSELNKSHCPLCHLNFPPGEEGWKQHLMGKDGCKQNPRRLASLNKQGAKGGAKFAAGSKGKGAQGKGTTSKGK